MPRVFFFSVFTFLLIAGTARAAEIPPVNAATVMIANYSDGGDFLGWGSGFFVDEGIVVTNKHVIEGGDWYRVYPTGSDNKVDFLCGKNITRSDVKINLNDDVAYMRVFLSCPHDVIRFADADPEVGVPVSVVGYRYKGTIEESLTLTTTVGEVTATTTEGWFETNAVLDVGNSGGPVVSGSAVVGVAVAIRIDAEGKFLNGFFIPSSVIESGLLYANDSRFGYTPQSRASSSRRTSSSSSVQSTRSSSSRSSFISSRRSSARSSVRSAPVEIVSASFKVRTCERVKRWFWNDPIMIGRINVRLEKRFGFVCR